MVLVFTISIYSIFHGVIFMAKMDLQVLVRYILMHFDKSILPCNMRYITIYINYYTNITCIIILGAVMGSIYNYQCNRCLLPLKLWVRIMIMAKCTRYNIYVIKFVCDLPHEIPQKFSRLPPQLKKIWFFGIKSWFFTRNTPKMFAPPSARRNFFKCTPLTWNPGSAPAYMW
jgi:hypothetical protein